MLTGKKIVITGVTGKAVEPIARALASDNEVYGVARFADRRDRDRISAAGITSCAADFETGDFSNVPKDPDFILHFAWMRAGLDELDKAIAVNVVGAGLLLQHCASAKAALIASSMGIYSAHDDPHHRFKESDAVGRASSAYAATSPVTKLGLEAVSRFCARAFNLPVTIARLNTVLGPVTAYHGHLCRNVMNGVETVLPGNPNLHSPIHTDDMIAQIEPLLEAATIPALTVNWCGDDTVSSQDSLDQIGVAYGRPARYRSETKDGVPQGNAADSALRRSITGPCKTSFAEGFATLIDEIGSSERP
ncbi:NAD-dependent epimerase/dehydratase family protein [Hyphomonas johnsonii]|uniref:NAD-dependent epimerase/dehydratase n=1 Tax=Hyphomonas johnsonii MHS-2 TaxID=1280950 RepID=A0A059FRF9_9PROT|nr:NAD(P)-dependent oxidoreductase [Hyphomonas johnsonii]KCZ93202.1 NAD-dependent epimerase/dehydratase [Hyphomonas johnsonii MHS-2]